MKRNLAIFLLWAISVIAALGTGHNLFYNLAYLLTATIVLAYLWAWNNGRGIRLERWTRSARSQVGKLAEERLEIYNATSFPKLWLEVRDYSNLPGHRASRVIHSLGGQCRRSWIVKTLCQQRGRFTLGPVTITSGDPLGLFTRRVDLPQTSSIIIYPATVDLAGFTPPIGLLPGGDAMRRRTHHITTNVSGVREYAPGDSFNRIHWRSTARTGRLIVKEFELDPTADLWLLLDMEESVQAGTPWEYRPRPQVPAMLWEERPRRLEIPPTTEEYSIVITASLARHFLSRGRAVGLITYAQQREVVQADRGERQLNKILETLAIIEACGRISLAEILTAEATHFSRNTSLIIITPSTRLDWIGVARDVNRRGLRIITVYLDARSFGTPLDSQIVISHLLSCGFPLYIVHKGDPLDVALGVPVQEGFPITGF